jgi:hypothetical protein
MLSIPRSIFFKGGAFVINYTSPEDFKFVLSYDSDLPKVYNHADEKA